MKTLKVLLVEDDRISAKAVEFDLLKLGHELIGIAESGDGALKLLESCRPDVVIMDFNLNGNLNGVEIAEIIIDRHDIPVVILTSYDPSVVFNENNETLVLGFVQKPPKLSELSASLHIAVERSAMDQKLKESEKKYRSLFENSLAGIFRLRPRGPFLVANSAFALMLGFQSVNELLNSVINADAQIFSGSETWSQTIECLRFNHIITEHETFVYGRDGQRVRLSLQLTALEDPDNADILIDGVAIDVTVRHETEENLQTSLNMLNQIVDKLSDPLMLTDLEHNIILANQSMRVVLGLETNISGEFCYLFSPPDRDHWQLAYNFMIEKMKASELIGKLTEDDCYRRISLTPYRGTQGEIIGVIYLAVPESIWPKRAKIT